MLETYMKNPLSAAAFAAIITMFVVYFTKGSKEVSNSAYTKPAFFVAVLVYFIVYTGNGKYETISKEPF
jgi:hypothetical protein